MNVSKRLITLFFVVIFSLFFIRPLYSNIEKTKEKIEELSKLTMKNPDKVSKADNGRLDIFRKVFGEVTVIAAQKFTILKFNTFDDSGKVESTGYIADFLNNGTINRYAIIPGEVDDIKDVITISDMLISFEEKQMVLGFSLARKKSSDQAIQKRKIYYIEYEKKEGGLIDMELDSSDALERDQIDTLQILYEEILEGIEG